MYKNVLVPLDGSEIAECALDELRKMAQEGWGCVGSVTLLYVVEVPAHWVAEGANVLDVVQFEFGRGQEYLNKVEESLAAENVAVKSVIVEGRAAETIVQYAKENEMDLIVVASHGYSGLKKWVFGSVALRVLHDSNVPVLLVRPKQPGT
ncbi:MAG: universal stress protein [Syntrophales bacterium]